ncbi:MAG: hypothetical protein U1E76_21125 [Planctomycetota bacterium]
MPDIPSFDFYLQYFNFDSGSANGQFGNERSQDAVHEVLIGSRPRTIPRVHCVLVLDSPSSASTRRGSPRWNRARDSPGLDDQTRNPIPTRVRLPGTYDVISLRDPVAP